MPFEKVLLLAGATSLVGVNATVPVNEVTVLSKASCAVIVMGKGTPASCVLPIPENANLARLPGVTLKRLEEPLLPPPVAVIFTPFCALVICALLTVSETPLIFTFFGVSLPVVSDKATESLNATSLLKASFAVILNENFAPATWSAIFDDKLKWS